MSDGRLEVELVTGIESLEALAPPWRALAEQRGNVFVTPEWYFTWVGSANGAAEPFVPVVRSPGGELVGLLPLVIETVGRTRSLTFAGAALGDYFHPVAEVADDVQVAEAAAPVLARERSRFDRVVLAQTDAGASWPAAFVAAARTGLAAIESGSGVLPYQALDGTSWEEYLATLSRRLRKQLRGEMRRLEREHQVGTRCTADAAELERDLDAFFRLHDVRQGRSSMLASDRARSFERAVARALLEQGWLRLCFLEVDGRPIVVSYGWSIGGRYCDYQGGFDPAFARHSPGILLLAATIRRAFDEAASVYDLLLGPEPYKLRFTSAARHVHTVTVVRRLSAAYVLVSGRALMRRLARRLPSGVRRKLEPVARLFRGRRVAPR